MTNHLQMTGEIEVDGETIKWDRNSFTGLVIEFPHKNKWDVGGRLHIGGEPDPNIIRFAIRVYRSAYQEGYAMGKTHLGLEIRKLIGAQ